MNFTQFIEHCASRGLHPHRESSSWKMRSPCREEKTGSLDAKEKDGLILLHDHGDPTLTAEKICAALGLSLSDLRTNGTADAPQRKIAATYDYTDENHQFLFQAVRYEPKGFSQRHRDANGGWIWNLNGVPRVLYNLPAVLPAETVFIAEGEKDADTLNAHGFVATTNPMGAGKWKAEFADSLCGKNVVILADNDPPGLNHARTVALSLHLKAKSIKLIEKLPVPADQPVKDISEWFALPGMDTRLLSAFVADSPVWTPEKKPETPRLDSSSVADLFCANEIIVAFLIWPFVCVGLSSIIDALPKVGKTELILRGILASRKNEPFLDYPTKPVRALFVSEQSKTSLAMQLRAIGFTGEEPVAELRFITREDWSRLTYDDLLLQIESEFLAHGTYNLIVIDTFHTVARMEDEKDASEVNRLGNLTLDLASRNNLALVFGRHDRKSGGEVGVSGRSSIQLSGLVDVILHIIRVPGEDNQRKMETLSRVPDLPGVQIIELRDGQYVNNGEPPSANQDRAAIVAQWLSANPTLSAQQICAKFVEMSIEISEATAKRYRARARGNKP